ncbi:hypothetical protein [Sorangium sp. So ce854]|uniref:hypothetical protein n=1 Tax=Sorangium sp. So ce854 TaxID=3133322 RepID=UPI003F6473FD
MAVCDSVYKFLRANYGRRCTAPLTGQDARALRSFVHLVELYRVSDEAGARCAIEAMRATVRAMQAKTRWIAREAIAAVADWEDREPVWREMFPDEPKCAGSAVYCTGCGAVMSVSSDGKTVCPACGGSRRSGEGA